MPIGEWTDVLKMIHILAILVLFLNSLFLNKLVLSNFVMKYMWPSIMSKGNALIIITNLDKTNPFKNTTRNTLKMPRVWIILSTSVFGTLGTSTKSCYKNQDQFRTNFITASYIHLDKLQRNLLHGKRITSWFNVWYLRWRDCPNKIHVDLPAIMKLEISFCLLVLSEEDHCTFDLWHVSSI